MSAQHTPGPWQYDYAPGYCGQLIAADGTVVGVFVEEPNAADAQLIAATPNLLKALIAMVDSVTGVDQMSAVNEARAAIAEATVTE